MAEPSTLIEIIRWVLSSYSPYVSQWALDYRLFTVSDALFLQNVFRFCMSRLSIRVVLTDSQFRSRGFVERKLLLVFDMIQKVERLHREQELLHRQRTSFTQPYRT